VTSKRDYLDEPVILYAGEGLRFSADALRALNKATGRTLTDLVDDEGDQVDRFQAMAFAELFRRAARAGHLPDAGELWERAGRVELCLEVARPLDPTPGEFSTTSPPSAPTGE
jgi:hypothetical protein